MGTIVRRRRKDIDVFNNTRGAGDGERGLSKDIEHEILTAFGEVGCAVGGELGVDGREGRGEKEEDYKGGEEESSLTLLHCEE